MNPLMLLSATPIALVMFLGAAFSGEAGAGTSATVDAAALPPLARQLLPDVEAIRARDCPQMPLAWLIAEVQAESSWNPLAYSSA